MALDQALKRSMELEGWATTALDGVALPSGRRNLIAAAAFSLALEHHRSINMLVSKSCFGSALALFRAALEAFLTGAWMLYQAKDAQIERFSAGVFTLGLSKLATEYLGGSFGPLTTADAQSLVSDCHSWTHISVTSVAARCGGDGATPIYDATLVEGMLDGAVRIVAGSVVDVIGGIVGDNSRATELADEAMHWLSRDQ